MRATPRMSVQEEECLCARCNNRAYPKGGVCHPAQVWSTPDTSGEPDQLCQSSPNSSAADVRAVSVPERATTGAKVVNGSDSPVRFTDHKSCKSAKLWIRSPPIKGEYVAIPFFCCLGAITSVILVQ